MPPRSEGCSRTQAALFNTFEQFGEGIWRRARGFRECATSGISGRILRVVRVLNERGVLCIAPGLFDRLRSSCAPPAETGSPSKVTTPRLEYTRL